MPITQTDHDIVEDGKGNVLEDVVVVRDVTERANKKTIEQQAAAAITTNQDFRAVASPTNAQVVAQVRALSLQNIKLIRYVFELLEDDE